MTSAYQSTYDNVESLVQNIVDAVENMDYCEEFYHMVFAVESHLDAITSIMREYVLQVKNKKRLYGDGSVPAGSVWIGTTAPQTKIEITKVQE